MKTALDIYHATTVRTMRIIKGKKREKLQQISLLEKQQKHN